MALTARQRTIRREVSALRKAVVRLEQAVQWVLKLSGRQTTDAEIQTIRGVQAVIRNQVKRKLAEHGLKGQDAV